MKKALLILSAVTLYYTARLHAQVVTEKNNNKQIVNKLEALAGNTAENVYLHFDKPYYNAGDTIYFKAYVTAGEKISYLKLAVYCM